MADEREENAVEPQINLPLSKAEANGLLDLLDLACHGGGLNAAGLASTLAERIQRSAKLLDSNQGDSPTS